MLNLVRRRAPVAALFALASLCAGTAAAQTAGLALRASLSYDADRLSLKLSPAQSKEAARLGEEADKARTAGKFGQALNLYAEGEAVMHGVAWTPEVAWASALRASLDHAEIDRARQLYGSVELNMEPAYVTDRASEVKLSATVVLMKGDKEDSVLAPKAAVDPAHMPFTAKFNIPPDAAGDYNVEVRLTGSDAAAPAPAALHSAFVKELPIHVEEFGGDVTRLRLTLDRLKNANPALATPEYTLQLFELADEGEVNPHDYNFRKEFTVAQDIVDAVQDGNDPFAGKLGDFRRAYRSPVDDTLQPYRILIPAGYDGTKPVPLLVALHGTGGDENTMFDRYGKELPADAGKAGFILVTPKGRDSASMYRGNAEEDVLDVIREVERDCRVDRTRIYLMGYSTGGDAAWRIAVDHPDQFAALGVISGSGDPAAMAKIRAIPEYVTHGDADRTDNVAAARATVEAGKKAGVPITYVEVTGGTHESVVQPAFAPMIEFFKKQSRPDAK